MRPAEIPYHVLADRAQLGQPAISQSIDGSNMGVKNVGMSTIVAPKIHMTPKSLTVHNLPIPPFFRGQDRPFNRLIAQQHSPSQAKL